MANELTVVMASGADTVIFDVGNLRANQSKMVPFKFIFPTMTNTSFTIEERIGEDWKAVEFLGAALTVLVGSGTQNLFPENCYALQNPIRLKGAEVEADARTITVQYTPL